MVQNVSWEWLLEGFKYELEAQVRPKTVEYYYDHARIFARWAESAGIAEPQLLSRRDLTAFFNHISNGYRLCERNNWLGKEARRVESLRWHYYRGIKRFLSWLVTEGYVDHNPLENIRFRPPKDPPIEPYVQEHKDKLFAVLEHDWKVAKKDS